MLLDLLSLDAAREVIDARDCFEALRAAQAELAHRYDGRMFFESRDGRDYLLRRRSGTQSKRSLGPRSPETEAMLAAFEEGQARLTARADGLRADLEARAPVLAARGLERVPRIVARLLRRLADTGWLGTRLPVVGTNALYAYEAMAGVIIEPGAVATGDVDVLLDARRRVSLAAAEPPPGGSVGLLRRVDRSFAPIGPRTFRAVNDQGFMVDLIVPMRGSPHMHMPGRLSEGPDDVEAVAIEGPTWLENAPKVERIAFDERGLPVAIPTVDPRVFALHEAWVAERPDRDPLRRRRDALQAAIAARIATRHLGLPFDDPALSALPARLGARSAALARVGENGERPEW